jgi:hypothetical protein
MILAMIFLCTIMAQYLLRHLFLFALLFAVVQADYFIDDSNSTIGYTSVIGSPWIELTVASGTLTGGNGSTIELDFTRLYDETMAFANCNTTQVCQIGIPFTGSGITVYGVLLPGPTNFTVTIDDAPAPPPILAPLRAITSPALYNVTLYDIQSLPLSFHMLTLSVVDWTSFTYSMMLFDYAYVNQAPPPTSTSATPASTATSIHTSSNGAPQPSALPFKSSAHKLQSTFGNGFGTTIGVFIILVAINAVIG